MLYQVGIIFLRMILFLSKAMIALLIIGGKAFQSGGRAVFIAEPGVKAAAKFVGAITNKTLEVNTTSMPVQVVSGIAAIAGVASPLLTSSCSVIQSFFGEPAHHNQVALRPAPWWGWGYDADDGISGTVLRDILRTSNRISAAWVTYLANFNIRKLLTFVATLIGITLSDDVNRTLWIIKWVLAMAVGYTYYVYTMKKGDENTRRSIRCWMNGDYEWNRPLIYALIALVIGVITSPALGFLNTYEALWDDGVSNEVALYLLSILSAGTATLSYLQSNSRYIYNMFAQGIRQLNRLPCSPLTALLTAPITILIVDALMSNGFAYYTGTQQTLTFGSDDWAVIISVGLIAIMSAACNAAVSLIFSLQNFEDACHYWKELIRNLWHACRGTIPYERMVATFPHSDRFEVVGDEDAFEMTLHDSDTAPSLHETVRASQLSDVEYPADNMQTYGGDMRLTLFGGSASSQRNIFDDAEDLDASFLGTSIGNNERPGPFAVYY